MRIHHKQNPSRQQPQNQKLLEHGRTEDLVSVKILNPVGYRIFQLDGLKGLVIVKEGEPMDTNVKKGTQPMQAKHIWWQVNPHSHSLRTLEKYSGKDNAAGKGVQVDQGSKGKGLQLSLIGA
jgi:hypothetical protein